MGLYGVFLALGQIVGAFAGAVAAELWALDGILMATLAFMGIALLPLARLRRFESTIDAQTARSVPLAQAGPVEQSAPVALASARVTVEDDP